MKPSSVTGLKLSTGDEAGTRGRRRADITVVGAVPRPRAREQDAVGMLASPAVAVVEEGLSDLETASFTGATNSSLSSASSADGLARCSILSRLSFDCS
jgi:hypothetical protein